ncbi:MAG: hypothetical protein K6U00_04990 [Armatimonadetes bacterium]|nr:hypothetical protein [Armatimonadota bacterium]
MPEVGQVAKMSHSCVRNFIISVAILAVGCVEALFAVEHSANTNVLPEQAAKQPMQQNDGGRSSFPDPPLAAESSTSTPGVCDPSLVHENARERWSSAAGMMKADEQRQALVSVLLSHRTSILVTIFGLITTVTALLRRRRH